VSGGRHGLGGGGAAGAGGKKAGAGGEKAGAAADRAAAGMGPDVKLLELPDIVTKRVAKLLEPSAANLPKLCDTHVRALSKSAHFFIHKGHYIFGGSCSDWIGRGKIWPSADLDVACCAQKTKEATAGFKIWTAEQGLDFASQGTKGRNVTWIKFAGGKAPLHLHWRSNLWTQMPSPTSQHLVQSVTSISIICAFVSTCALF
jgi:hypothetical protein